MVLEAQKLPEKFLIDPPKEGGHGQNFGIQKLKQRIQFGQIGQISDMINMIHRNILVNSRLNENNTRNS